MSTVAMSIYRDSTFLYASTEHVICLYVSTCAYIKCRHLLNRDLSLRIFAYVAYVDYRA